jgi:hypothetical protein
MSNPTTRVASAVVHYDNDTFYWPLKGGSFATKTYQNGEMIGRRSDGYAQSMDDSAALDFLGIVVEHHVQVDAGDADGDKQVLLCRPLKIEMPLDSGTASLASNAGAALYSSDSGHVSLSSGSFGNIVGYLSHVIGTTPRSLTGSQVGFAPCSFDNFAGGGAVAGNATVTALASSGDITITGADLVFSGTTGQNDIKMTDNLASALTISEGANAYVTFVTTNSGEKITFSKAIEVATTLTYTGATGVNKILMQDNLASALIIGEGSNAYITFVTTDSSEKITVAKDIASSKGFTSSAPTGVGIGYATGAGGAVTQATDRTTGVTLSKLTGQITTNNASLAAGAEAEFTVTNTHGRGHRHDRPEHHAGRDRDAVRVREHRRCGLVQDHRHESSRIDGRHERGRHQLHRHQGSGCLTSGPNEKTSG